MTNTWRHVDRVICAFVLERSCCGVYEGDSITAAQVEAGETPDTGDLCSGHRGRFEVICGRPEHPPLAAEWPHRRWTGHAFEPCSTFVSEIAS